MNFRNNAPDCRALVRDRLRLSHPDIAESEEIVAELASHLEEVFEEQRGVGATEQAALEAALREISDLDRVSRRIRRAKREEGKMNDRTRHFWLPGLGSFGAAVLCEVLLARWSYQTRMLSSSHLTQIMYALWLIAQLGCGAVGAYLSRRAGGRRSARLGAALFTSAIWLAVLLGVVGTSLFARVTGLWYQDFGSIDLQMIARVIVVMVGIPSLAMVAGAAPFLSKEKNGAIA